MATGAVPDPQLSLSGTAITSRFTAVVCLGQVRGYEFRCEWRTALGKYYTLNQLGITPTIHRETVEFQTRMFSSLACKARGFGASVRRCGASAQKHAKPRGARRTGPAVIIGGSRPSPHTSALERPGLDVSSFQLGALFAGR